MIRWFDRKFNLDLPVWMFPAVVERLRGTPARVEELVAGVAPELLTRHVADTWSIKENVGHLLDLEPIWIGRTRDIFEGAPRLGDADLSNRLTHEAGHDARPLSGILDSFRELRGRLVADLDRADEAAIERSAIHPRLEKPMRLLDLAFFVAEHDDHHLARITFLRREA